ncbi:SDR family oxidoreductase [candidate division KSB1 bacterium]|nr:SDR family oxidoreductase [candidate division KSB1 bacterium]
MIFKDKTAIITGATGGLGATVVRHFIKNGAKVAAIGRNSSTLQTLKQNFNKDNSPDIYAADITRHDEVIKVFDGIIQKFNQIDILVNITGGFAGGKSIADTDPAMWENMMKLNLTSAFLCSRQAMVYMTEQGHGKIITITAMAALEPKPNRAAYAVSKAGVIALTQALAVEGQTVNVQANTIAPGIILTKANKDSMPDADFSKWVTPDRLAETVLFLCSPKADNITGTIIRMP